MPVPIRPVNDFTLPAGEDANNGQIMIDFDALSQAVSGIGLSPRKKVDASLSATDSDADALFGLWQKMDGDGGEGSAEDTQYSIPKDYPQNDILRLKASGLWPGCLHHLTGC